VSRDDEYQWRNFGLKSRVSIEKENDVPLAPEVRGEENEEEVLPSSSDSVVWKSLVSSPCSGVRYGVPAENGFILI